MKGETSTLQPTKRGAPLKLLTVDEIFDRMREVYETIARRAYELFEANGRQLGRELEDWLKAESEILHPVHVDVAETEGELKVRAEVPGFTEKDLEVSVEPRHLTITGKRVSAEQRKKGKTVYSEQCSNQILRALELPVVVDTQKVTSTIEDGILELVIPKAASATKFRIETKAA